MVKYMALDIGERRVGVALADDTVKIAVPHTVIDVDGNEFEAVAHIVSTEDISVIVAGYPRNQSGEPTAQTQYSQAFVANLPKEIAEKVIFQDESLTSVQAEQYLKAEGKPYTKGDVDKLAASIILQDYLEQQDGRI